MTRQELKFRARQQLGSSLFHNNWLLALVACLIVTILLGLCGTVIPGAGMLILVGPLTFGQCYLFLKQSRDGAPMNLSDTFSGFTSDFGGILLIGLMTTIFTALWSCLFVIPGIIKSYAYSMAYYIKADNPGYSWRQCMDASISMMKGHKLELFALDLSFIGWYIVGSLCLGVGTLWVVPYHQAARAQFYNNLVGPVSYRQPGSNNYDQPLFY